MKKRHNWRKVIRISMVVVFIFGLFTFLFPKIMGHYLDNRTAEEINAIIDWIEDERNKPVESDATTTLTETELALYPKETPLHHLQFWKAVVAYNEKIWINKQSNLKDPWSYQQPSFNLGDFDLHHNAFGILEIPSINLDIPIYLGGSNDNLQLGVAHLTQTSLPIGGANTNCVLAGHNGWKGGTFFRNLKDVKIGDDVFVVNLWTTLQYRVVETKVIGPRDMHELLIQPGKDMLTLLTCTSNGKQRFVVYCERVDVDNPQTTLIKIK